MIRPKISELKGSRNAMNILPYILISLLGGAIVPLQLAIVNAFQKTTQASQIQSTFYLYDTGKRRENKAHKQHNVGNNKNLSRNK